MTADRLSVLITDPSLVDTSEAKGGHLVDTGVHQKASEGRPVPEGGHLWTPLSPEGLGEKEKIVISDFKGGRHQNRGLLTENAPSRPAFEVDTRCPPVSTEVSTVTDGDTHPIPRQHPITGLWWVELEPPGEWIEKKRWERRADGGWRYIGTDIVRSHPARVWGGYGRRRRWWRTREAALAAVEKAQRESPWELDRGADDQPIRERRRS